MNKILALALALTLISCGTKQSSQNYIGEQKMENTITAAQQAFPQADTELLRKGIEQCAKLWKEEDGTPEDFAQFVLENYASDQETRKVLFDKLSTAFEVFSGYHDQMSVELQYPVHLAGPKLENVDYIFGAFDPAAHFSDDMFANKIAFITILNFPCFSLEEKNNQSAKWSRLDWAYARMGDVFTSRIPASISQQYNEAISRADNYISEYNIMMGHILNEDGERIFPEDMVLLSHWNLRDQIKSDYSDGNTERQLMIQKIMEHIVYQTIPQIVINNPDYDWKPYSNKVYKDGKEIKFTEETDARYARILDIFHSEQAIDQYQTQLNTGIKRNFEGSMQVQAEEIEKLFIELLSSDEVKKTAELIKSKLGRDLHPYDIWYDGFKQRSSISEDQLNKQTRTLYPNEKAFEANMPKLLTRLGFSAEKAKEIASHIVVENARGSGHAWPAVGHNEQSRLRTRVGAGGMDYKGYNIAIHEFGHNVEQTLSLFDMDYYMLSSIPNTAFTEALAFVFQKRDLQLLGYKFEADANATLDIFWGAYEIMGVSLVDMYVWKWLYSNPNATALQLKEAVISIAKDVWNKYYESVLGVHDFPLLAIYSHMISSPMYLPNYPYGTLIEYQLENHFSSLKSSAEFAQEIERIYTIGRLTPNAWMREAVGSDVDVKALIEATRKALD